MDIMSTSSVPADTQRNNNVIMTLRRRFDVMMTLFLRHVPVGMCTFNHILGLSEFSVIHSYLQVGAFRVFWW